MNRKERRAANKRRTSPADASAFGSTGLSIASSPPKQAVFMDGQVNEAEASLHILALDPENGGLNLSTDMRLAITTQAENHCRRRGNAACHYNAGNCTRRWHRAKAVAFRQGACAGMRQGGLFIPQSPTVVAMSGGSPADGRRRSRIVRHRRHHPACDLFLRA